VKTDTTRPEPMDRKSGVPLYLQLATVIRHRIERGTLVEGSKVPSLHDLQGEFGVARITARQAMDRLESEGLISRHKGKGTFVKSNGTERHWLHLTTRWKALMRELSQNSPTQIPVDKPPPLPPLDKGIKPAKEYVYLRSVQSRDNDPYAVVNVHLAKDIFRRNRKNFLSRSILPTLADMEGVHVTRARQTLFIGSADPYVASLLRIPLNTPTAEAHWVVVDDKNIAVYVAEVTYRGDCIKMMIDFL
jgi:GntR family transcriptional regulator